MPLHCLYVSKQLGGALAIVWLHADSEALCICMPHLICWDGCTRQLQRQRSCSSSAGIEHADQQNNLLARASCGHKLLDNELQHVKHCVALWWNVSRLVITDIPTASQT